MTLCPMGVDYGTGEVRWDSEPYLMVVQPAAREVARRSPLSTSAYRLLFLMLAEVGIGCMTSITAKKIQDELKISRSMAYGALDELRRSELAHMVENGHELSPHLAWKGGMGGRRYRLQNDWESDGPRYVALLRRIAEERDGKAR